MTPTAPKTKREPIKTIGKHKFYEIQQADEILHTRYMVAEVQELYIRAGMSQDFIGGMCDLMIQRSMDAKDLQTLKNDITAIGMNMKGRLGFMASMKMYEELACVYFMMDDEPAEYLPEWQAKKKAVWAKDRDFFLHVAYLRMNGSQDISMTDIIAAFQAVEERLAQLPTLPTS